MKRSLSLSIYCMSVMASLGNLSDQSAGNYAPRDYSIVPPAPQVAAFFEAKDYPVDYFRGVPQIEFPLYVIKSGQIEMPVTLMYHGGGIRVDQNTGNAGLGWSVSCGAVISHTVYGAPDDANDRIHGLWHLNSDEKEFRKQLISKMADYDPTNGDEYRQKRSWQAILGSRYYQGLTDVANDLYSLYGCGLSATFAVTENRQIAVSADQPIKIEQNSDFERITDGGCDGRGFCVTTTQGLKYKFGVQERTKYKYFYGVPELTQSEDSVYYCSAWHLSGISDNAGNEVKFTYIPDKLRVNRTTSHPVAYGYSNEDLAMMSQTHTSGVGCVEYYPKVLQEITCEGIKVSFKYYHLSSSNSDALLEEIRITPADGDARVIRFNYNGKHLRSITDQGEEVYCFSYYESDGSGGQDFGGYPNGSGNPSLKIPTVKIGTGQVGDRADRSVDPLFSADDCLKRIDYATGGYTEFEWESNTFSHVNNKPFTGQLSETVHVTKVVTDTLRACNEAGYAKLELKGWRLPKGHKAELDLTHYFEMNPANLFGSAYYNSHVYDVYPELNPPHHPHVIIRDHVTQKIEKVYFLDSETIEPNGTKKVTSLPLEPGIYDFELKFPGEVQGAEYFMENELRFHDCIAGYIYIRDVSTDANEPRGHENWCGVRIKRITSSTGDSDDESDVLRKDFYYNREGDPKATSGTVQMLPRFDYMHYKNLPCQDLPGYESSEVYCVGAEAFPQTPNGALSSIEYPIVSTCLGKEDPLEPDGYLHYFWQTNYYSSSQDASVNDYNYSHFKEYQPIGARMYTSRAHRRGNLTRVIQNYITLPGVTRDYSYNIYESDHTPVLTTDAFVVCDFTMAPGDNTYGTYDYSIGTYTLIPYNKTVNYEGTSQYDGLDTYKRYNYFYDSYTDALDWNLPKSMIAGDSEYGTSETHYTYLRGKNGYMPYPETEVMISGGKVISAVRTEYDKLTNQPVRSYTLSRLVLPSDILSDNQQTTASQILNISKPTYEYKYNGRGNLIEISYDGVALASYIWGYNGNYPIIEATDTDYETLSAAARQSGVTTEQLEGRTIMSDAAIKTLSGKLRRCLPYGNITAISYHWLLGMARFITPRGDDTSYTYDRSGRLIEIRDFNTYLINKYTYHYANSPTE